MKARKRRVDFALHRAVGGIRRGFGSCSRRIDVQRDALHQEQDDLVLRSGPMLKAMSLEYAPLMADLYWTRVVQYYGDKHARHDANFELLWPLLDVTTTLDPNLLVAYRFGSMFLSEGPPARRRKAGPGDRIDSPRNSGESGLLAVLRRPGIHLLFRASRTIRKRRQRFWKAARIRSTSLDEGAGREGVGAGRDSRDVGVSVERNLQFDDRSADESKTR